MNPKLKVWSLCILALILFMTLSISVGCQQGDIKQDILVTFDGEECIYDGPSVVAEGPRIMTLKNTTEYKSVLGVAKLDEGKTWQDLIDYVGKPGSSQSEYPPFLSDVINLTVQDNPDAREYQLEEGLYGIWCGDLLKIWPAAPLEVKGN